MKDTRHNESFDPSKSPGSLANELQTLSDRLINSWEAVDWDENAITLGLIKIIRSSLERYKIPGIVPDSLRNKFDVEAYKLTGNPEQKYGDIAIIITRIFPGLPIPISGVAFYEAKASDPHGDTFPSFSIQQLRRLVTHTPRLNYLLYNKKGMPAIISDWPLGLRDDAPTKVVHAMSVDANFLKGHRHLNSACICAGTPFGHHFVHRVLSGKELDYSGPPEKIIRKWLKITKKSSPVIVTVSIYESKDDSFDTAISLPHLQRIPLSHIPPRNNNIKDIE